MSKNYLWNLFKAFLGSIRLFKKSDLELKQKKPLIERKEIDQNIDKDELLVRAIVRPLMFSSKAGLQSNAVLPPPNQCDVSLIRHKYKDDHFCKNHGKSLKVGSNTYCGLAVIKEGNITQVKSNHPNIGVQVIASPLDTEQKVRTDWPIYVDDAGFPAHGSIMYDVPPRNAGEPNPAYILFAKQLVKKLQYFPDPDPTGNDWTGNPLS